MKIFFLIIKQQAVNPHQCLHTYVPALLVVTRQISYRNHVTILYYWKFSHRSSYDEFYIQINIIINNVFKQRIVLCVTHIMDLIYYFYITMGMVCTLFQYSNSILSFNQSHKLFIIDFLKYGHIAKNRQTRALAHLLILSLFIDITPCYRVYMVNDINHSKNHAYARVPQEGAVRMLD